MTINHDVKNVVFGEKNICDNLFNPNMGIVIFHISSMYDVQTENDTSIKRRISNGYVSFYWCFIQADI